MVLRGCWLGWVGVCATPPQGFLDLTDQLIDLPTLPTLCLGQVSEIRTRLRDVAKRLNIDKNSVPGPQVRRPAPSSWSDGWMGSVLLHVHIHNNTTHNTNTKIHSRWTWRT